MQSDPVHFVEEILGETLWAKEKEILEAVRNHPRVAVVKANAVGGTFTAARAALWWLNCFAPSKVITTAPPPDRQIKDLLWGELRGAQRKALARGAALVGGEPLTMKLSVSDEHWAQGFTIPLNGTREERVAKFQGHHSPNLFAIYDEAHGIPDEVWEAMDSCLSGGNCRWLLLSNPLAASGPFYQRVRSGGWHVVEISALEHPNVVTGENVIPGCVDRAKTVERIQKWSEPVGAPDASAFQVPEFLDGEQAVPDKPALVGGEWRVPISPLLDSKTLARFPTIGGGLIPLAWVQRANALWLEREGKGGGDLILGVDPARYGADLSAVAWHRGETVENGTVEKVETMAKADTMELAGYIKRCLMKPVLDASGRMTEVPVGIAKVEITGGLGAGPYDRLRELGVPVQAVSIEGGAEGLTDATGEMLFANLRSYLHYALRDALEAGELALPPDEELTEEITAVQTGPAPYTSAGKFKLPSKDQEKKLLGRSPDKKDAVLMLFAPVEVLAHLPSAESQPRQPSRWKGQAKFGGEGKRWR